MALLPLLAAFTVLNLAAIAVGYYIGLRHIDRILDIEEGSEEAAFPPGFDERGGRRVGPLSPEDIDEIDDWDRWE